jgi:gliding motility-associated-like protein
MKVKLSLIIVIILSCAFHAYSQPNQTAIWYFGHNAGIHFVNGTPVTLTGGQINNVEGCAVQSDNYGNLLFYTDGVTVWDRNHNPMPNGTGLNGNTSTTQNLIVQKPGDCKKFYIFHQNGQIDLQSYYSIVDMSLNGGLGDIVLASKNTFLYYPATEKITSVLHQNGTDIWVIMHEMNTNKFMSYLVTATGISAPVNTNIGPVHNNMIGYMKASHDGTKLAAAISFGLSQTELFDFNKSTGAVSNPFLINSMVGPYGLEFSPNDSILYVSTFWSLNTLYQINLVNNTSQTIVTGLNTNYDFGALQMGPNGKIYMTRNNQSYLCAINDPNILGAGCNYQNAAVTLAPGTWGASGLPAFNQALFNYIPGSFTFVPQNCLTYDFHGAIVVAYDSVAWNFGDPATGTNNTSDTLDAQHTFSSPGTYNISLIIYTYCYTDTIHQQVVITGSGSFVNLGNDTTLCPGMSLMLDAGPGFMHYIWQDGDTTQANIAANAGFYSVTVSDSSGCVAKDSIQINIVNPPAVFTLGNDTTFCQGGQYVLNAGAGYNNYFWQNNSTNQNLTVTQSGIYSVTASSICLTTSDSILVTVNPNPQIDLGPDSAICQGTSLLLDAGGGYANYLWQDGLTVQVYVAASAGNYSVTVNDNSGCTDRDSIQISVIPVPPAFDLGNDTAICLGASLLLNTAAGYDAYVWQNGDSIQNFTVTQSGAYAVTATSACLTTVDSITVTVNPLPSVDLGPDTAICQGTSLLLDAGTGFAGYLWQDGMTVQTYVAASSGNYSVTVQDNNGCSDRDSIQLSLILLPPVIDLGNDTTFCTGGSFVLITAAGYDSYNWQNGDTNQNFTVTQSGSYAVTATSVCITLMDSINVTVDPMPSVNLGSDTVLCQGTNLILDAGSGFAAYIWQDASTQQTFTVTASGHYSVTVSNGPGCSASDQLGVTLQLLPEVELGTGFRLCNPKEALLDAEQNQGMCHYLWQDGSLQSSCLVTAGGTYAVSVTNACGTVSDSIYFEDCPDCIIDLPNAFSPNGDGKNDVLYILGSGYTNIELLIYNRHGEKVFETNDQAVGWDGKYKGVLQENEVYYYYLKALCINGKEVSKKGDVTLLN